MFEDMYLNTLYKALHGLRLRNVMAACCTKFDRTRDDTCANFVNFLRPNLVIEAFGQLLAYHNESCL